MELEKIIEQNKNLIKNIARKYFVKNSVFSIEDLEQVGYLSLTKNYKKYDPQRASITTFITVCVKNDIIKYIKKQKIKKQPQYKMGEASYVQNDLIGDITPSDPDIKNIIEMKSHGFSIREISDKTNKSEKQIRRLIKKIRALNE